MFGVALSGQVVYFWQTGLFRAFISVVVQCINSVLLRDGFVDDDRPE